VLEEYRGKKLGKALIELPFPQQVIHFANTPEQKFTNAPEKK